MSGGIQEKRIKASGAMLDWAALRLAVPLEWSGDCALDLPAHGRSSLVGLLRPGSGRPAAVCAYARMNEYRRACRAAALQALCPQALPAIYSKGSGWLDRVRFGYAFIAHECIAGIHPAAPLSNRQSEGLANALRALHSVQFDAGRSSRRVRGFFKLFSRELEARVDHLKRHGGFPGLEQAMHWMSDRAASLPQPSRLSLVHAGLAPDDMLWDEASGRMKLIDCDELAWGRPGVDLAPVRYCFFEKDDSGWRTFLEAYLAGGTEAGRNAVESELPLFQAAYCLRKMRSRNPANRAKACLWLTALIEARDRPLT